MYLGNVAGSEEMPEAPEAVRRVMAEPRNVWSRLLAMDTLAKSGDLYAAARALEGVRYHPDLTPDLFELYRTRLQRAGNLDRINIPADYLARDFGVMHKPFRQVAPDSRFPSPFPYGMALPPLAGQRNDFRFLQDAATQLRGRPVERVRVVWSPLDCRDAGPVLEALANQGFGGTVSVTVLAGGREVPAGLDGALLPCEILHAGLLSAEGAARVAGLAEDADLVLFLAGDVRLDDGALQRAAFLPRVSDMVVQPLTTLSGQMAMESVFSGAAVAENFSSRYPFRNANGMNFAIPSTLLRRLGSPDPRFAGTFTAAREFLFRAFNAGCYFAPLAVPHLEGFMEAETPDQDAGLYIQLCPDHWGRRTDGQFEVPRVSVYVPVYNASKYIERAVDSVLEQDVQDLEVCLHDDGSGDDTLYVLKSRYAEEPRVRWQSNPNGGIGFASNQAIGMSRAMYIGQLDSDDCLKPGAVRRLAEHLDENPDLACCYASCERIDAGGAYIQDEYSWPVFSREKMMITSIAHHFRMFRRAAWERTTKFREDIVNAVDYDIFLKMSEVGPFHHIDEKLYQRRWHGENTSNVNEGFQTTNTYRVQRQALARQGLAPFWDVHLPDPEQPRKVTYRRTDKPMVFFWPHYRSNPYQRLLYAGAGSRVEFVAGKLEAALRLIESDEQPGQIIFHLHWLNFLFAEITDPVEARSRVDDFLIKLMQFKARGGRLVWTIHNTLSHDMPFTDLERELSMRLTELADVLHFHSAASIPEVEAAFPIPRDKVRICPHGAYIGAYPDFVTRAQARRALDIGEQDEVILFAGQIRPYKGVEGLVASFRRILAERPDALLLVAGIASFNPLESIAPALSEAERARIRLADRFLEDGELQLFFRAADMAVFPYQKILTSGSMLLALSYGAPVVIPRVGMTAEVLDGRDAGLTYDGAGGEVALEAALRDMFARKDAGELAQMGANARALAEELEWQDFSGVLA